MQTLAQLKEGQGFGELALQERFSSGSPRGGWGWRLASNKRKFQRSMA